MHIPGIPSTLAAIRAIVSGIAIKRTRKPRNGRRRKRNESVVSSAPRRQRCMSMTPTGMQRVNWKGVKYMNLIVSARRERSRYGERAGAKP
jgi:hypothetical protein